MDKASHAAPAPLGFRTAKTEAAGPRLLLVADVPAAVTAANLAACVEGADAAIISPPRAGAAPKPPKGLPWGVKAAGTKGADFIILEAASPVAAAPEDDATATILEIDAGWSEGELRAAGDLPLDAVLAGGILKANEKLTWQHLIAVQRLAAFTGQHLLLAAPPTLTESEVKALWEAGADALVVDAAKAGALKKLKDTLAGVKFPATRKKNKAEALVPRLGLGAGEGMAEPDEDDDWDDE
jgi:hypothetical protein